MLVLTRKKGESIILGDNIEVKVLDLHSSQAKLGVQAPDQVTVHRKEIYEAIQEENRAAASSPSENIDHLPKIFPREQDRPPEDK